MNWIYKMNEAIQFIDAHLEDDIDLEQVAKIACCSLYHFQRVFSFIANIPLSEYIRRRRMTLAAKELQTSEMKVIDIALKYGYQSPTAFNRAFQSIHGISPSAARSENITVTSYQPISFKLTIQGVEEMKYKIEKKEPIRIVGITKPLHQDLEKNFQIVPAMWEQASIDGTLENLTKIMNCEPYGLIGATISRGKEQWQYVISVASNERILDEKWQEFKIPSYTWAIFEGEGKAIAIQQLEKRIITEWLPNSGYEYDDGTELEIYKNPDPENAVFEVWIPIIKK